MKSHAVFAFLASCVLVAPFSGAGASEDAGRPPSLPNASRKMPRYAWRGYMLDCARHFFTATEIKKTLETMHAFGLNVFHWHLTDSAGWRVPITRYPELTRTGAVRQASRTRRSTMSRDDVDGTYGPFSYSREEIREIVRHAAELGIRVVPEIDIPGHSAAAIRAYPELGCVNSRHASQLCLGKDAVLRFYENVIDEVLELFPDQVVHLGGDECNLSRWRNCPDCQRRIRERGLRDERDLQAWFTVRFAKYLESKGRRMMGWDDILDADDLPKDVIVMVYRGSKKSGVEAARRGHDVVESPDTFCYLDYVQGLADDPYEYQPFGCTVTWKKIAGFDPGADYPAELRSKVLGAQGNLWTELVCDMKGVEWRTWPRLAALADVLANGPARDLGAFASRMAAASDKLRAMRVNAAPSGPLFAAEPCLEPDVKCLWLRAGSAKLLPGAIEPDALCFEPRSWNFARQIMARREPTLQTGQFIADLDWAGIEIAAADAAGFTNACRQIGKMIRPKADGVMEFPSCRIAGKGAKLRPLTRSELGVANRVYTNAMGKACRYQWAEPRHMELGANYPLRILSPEMSPEKILNQWRAANFEAFLLVPENMLDAGELVRHLCRTVRPLNRHDIRAVDARQPLFRVGLVTDTHIHDNPESCALVTKAMELFRRERVDVLCHLGDLANEYAPRGFEEYRRCIDRAFGADTPLTLYAFGGHDRNRYRLRPGEKNREEAVFSIMREKMRIPHGLCDIVNFKGYRFVIIQEYFNDREAANLVERAAAENPPGRPIFVLEHEPAWNTTCDSLAWGNRRIRAICEKHPEIVHFSGHTHGSLRDERSIWQGAFTEVNLGCLYVWLGDEANVCTRRNDWAHKPEQGVAVMDVHSDSIVIRRFSLVDGTECRPLDPWTVLVPHDPARAPYSPAVRKARSKAPVWPNGAAVTAVWKEQGKFRGYEVSCPVARHAEETFLYSVELHALEGGGERRVSVKERMGEFWKLPESERLARPFVEFPDGYFKPGARYRFVVRPMDFYGNPGRPLATEVTAPDFAPDVECVWSSENPMRDCAFSTHEWGKNRRMVSVGADGFVDLCSEMASIDLPQAAAIAADVPVGTDFRLSYTLDDRHAERTGWQIQNENAATGRRLGFRYLQSVRGSVGPIRYVTYLTKTESGSLPVRIGLQYGDRGARLRLSDMTLERIR